MIPGFSIIQQALCHTGAIYEDLPKPVLAYSSRKSPEMISEYHHHARDDTAAKSQLQGSCSFPSVHTSIPWPLGCPENGRPSTHQGTGGWVSRAVVQLRMGNIPPEEVSGARGPLVQELSMVSGSRCASAATTVATPAGSTHR